MSAEPQPKTPVTTQDEIPAEPDLDPPSKAQQRQLELEAAILEELRRMNRLLYAISYGPRRYTLAFFSGIVRGLGALLGATVVFALLIGLLSRLDTVPLIGSYVTQVLEFVQQNVALPQSLNGKGEKAATPEEPRETPVEKTPAGTPAP